MTGVAAGSVEFLDGQTVLGSAPLNSTGTALLSTAALAVGTHALTARYVGDGDLVASSSPVAATQLVSYAVELHYDTTKGWSSGAKVPVTLSLRDAEGRNLSDPSLMVTVAGLTPSPAPGAPPSGTFRYLSTGPGPSYQLLVDTRKYPRADYLLSFTVTGDPVVHTASFRVAK